MRINSQLKILCSLSLLVIFCCSSWYIFVGFPIPRPVLIFGLLGVSLSLLSASVFFTDTPAGYTLVAAIGILNGFFLRVSGFLTVVSSGLDHGRWIARASSTIKAGSVTGSDMYAASPVYILKMTLSHLVLGGPIHSVRFIMLLISALLPLLLSLLAYSESRDLRVSVFTLLLTIPFVFYTRTATLLEAESLALLWFVLATFFFIRSLRAPDWRHYTLLTATVGTAVMLHFFYSIVILLSLVGAYIIHTVASDFGIVDQLPGDANVVKSAIAVGVVITPIWMLWSTYSHTAAVTLLSAFSIPAYESIAEIFIPSSGASAQGTGASGGGSDSLIITFGKFLPVLAIFGIGGLGSIYTFIVERRRYYVLIILAVIVGGATFGIIAVQLDYNLGFRMYYFAGIFAIIFAAIFLTRLSDAQSPSIRRLALVFVLIFILVYAVGSPLSPLGNNVDPRFGGSSWTVTKTDVAERNAMDSWTGGDVRIPHSLTQVHGSFSPKFESETVYLARSCGTNAKIGTTGGLVLCGS